MRLNNPKTQQSKSCLIRRLAEDSNVKNVVISGMCDSASQSDHVQCAATTGVLGHLQANSFYNITTCDLTVKPALAARHKS